MIITNKVTMDLAKPNWISSIDAVQDDRYARNLEISLYSGGESWTIPEDATAMIRYSKPDGIGGLYDTLPDGTTGWSISGNLLTVALAPQVLTTPGSTLLAVTLTRGVRQISTFAIVLNVHPSVKAPMAESETYINIHNFLPAPADGTVGQFLRVAAVDDNGHITALDSAPGGGTGSMAVTYLEADGVGSQQNDAAPGHGLWSQWDSRLAFGMDTAAAPAPFYVGGQLLADGTVIAHNNGTQDKNRWGFHVFEAYAKDNYSRMTMLLDKHTAEANGKPSLELYYYTGSNHTAASYGNTKIGSDVAFHSFCFDRDKLTAYGEIDSKMPITLARIRLSSDLNTTYQTVAAADGAYEPELYPEENSRCLKFIALKNAQNGAMFYDEDRHQIACKINGQWCALPFTVIEDDAFAIFDDSGSSDDSGTDTETETVAWSSGVIDGNGGITANSGRLYTTDYLPDSAVSVMAATGYEFCLVPYNDAGLTNAPAPYYNPVTGNLEGAAAYISYLDLTSVSVSGFPNYRLIARRSDLADIAVSEGSNITVSCQEAQTPDTSSMEWKNGIIDGNGSIAENAARLYTPNYIPEEAVSVTAADGYEFCVVPYNTDGVTNAPNPYYDPEGNTFSSTGAIWYRYVDLTAISLGTGWIESDSEFTNFKLLARRTDLAAITPAEGSNIIIA